MLKNYLKIALRHLRRHKGYSLINIAGLAVGMACCLLILLYVQDELSYDRFHAGAEHIYRVPVSIDTRGVPTHFAPVMGPLADALRQDHDDAIDEVVQVLPMGTVLVQTTDGEAHYEERTYLVDANFFRIFSYPLLHGDPATAFSQPNEVVLTRANAVKYFGVEDAIGQRLEVNGNPVLVSGVLADLPRNSHFQPELLGSLDIVRNRPFMQNWHATMLYTYIKTAPGVNAALLEPKLRHIADRYVGEAIRSNNQEYTFALQPITDIHLHSHLRYELEANSYVAYVYIFTAVALLILVIACINFMNLATARSARRSREVGMRKVAGAHRQQLVWQFLGESILLSLLALLLALLLVELFLPAFNALAAKTLQFKIMENGTLAIALLVIAIVTGGLAGSYPAFFISAFQPVAVLKGQNTAGSTSARGGAHRLRQVLVVLQFAISIVLIAGTLVISSQLHYLRAQQLGFEKEQVLVLAARGGNALAERFETVKAELLRLPGVVAASASHSVPGRGVSNNLMNLREQRDNRVQMNLLFVDPDFLDTYGIELVAGRNFSAAMPTDLGGKVALMNEAAVRAFGWHDPAAAVGQQMGGFTGPQNIGVVRDFHYKSLHEAVEPLMLLVLPSNFQYLSLRIAPGDTRALISALEQQWKTLMPGTPFEYFFLDDDYDKQYQAEARLGEVFNAFAGLAIFIACLGLLGLASFSAEQRTKEIGIRKVLGATVANVTGLLSREFVWLVLIANALAWPVAWFAINLWLQNFAYRVEIGWWVFVLAGGLALLIALVTVSTQAIKAALVNPVDSLRSE